MAFSHGSKQRLYLNGADISLFIRSVVPNRAADVVDTSTLGTSDKRFLPGMLDARLTCEGFFDGAVGAIDERFAAILGDVTKDPATPTVPGGSRGAIFTHCVQGDIFGGVCYGFAGFAAQYAVNNDIGDAAKINIDAQSYYGYERLFNLHPFGGQSSAGNGVSIDFGIPSSANINGRLFVQSGALPAIDITLQLEHSVDNAVWASLGAPIVLLDTTPGGQRIFFTGALRRYARITWSNPGAASLPFHVAYGRDR